MIERAIEFAAKKHAGQVDKAGVPYIYHPIRVMLNVMHLGEEYACVGVLHDVVEDCYGEKDHQIAYADLEKIGMTQVIIDGVDSVTRREHPNREIYMDFIKRSKQNKIGKAVKVADIMDNMSRMEYMLDKSKVEGLRRRYTRAMQELVF